MAAASAGKQDLLSQLTFVVLFEGQKEEGVLALRDHLVLFFRCVRCFFRPSPSTRAIDSKEACIPRDAARGGGVTLSACRDSVQCSVAVLW